MSVKLFGLLFFVLLGMGLPIFLVLGGSAGLMFGVSGQPLVGIAQKMLDEMNSTTLLAVPFFVMAAAFMQHGGIAKALVDVAAAWVGWARGGLGVVCVAACAMFAAICGSSVATALAMGTILIPAMIARGYPRTFALGVTAASGTLGILIPPSLPLILYAVIVDESVPRLFLAGVVPGILQAGLFIAYVLWYGRRNDLVREPRRDVREFVRVNLRALPALSLPVIIAVGIYGGIVTTTEAAAFAAIVALLVALFFYKGFPPGRAQCDRRRDQERRHDHHHHRLRAGLRPLAHRSGIPASLVRFITDNGFSAWQFLLAINIMLIVLGMFLEVASIILIAVPILYPVLKPLGVDPVHFAIVITINMELALITAPVGLNLYVLSSVSGTPIGVVIRASIRSVLMVGLLMLVTTSPRVSSGCPIWSTAPPTALECAMRRANPLIATFLVQTLCSAAVLALATMMPKVGPDVGAQLGDRCLHRDHLCRRRDLLVLSAAPCPLRRGALSQAALLSGAVGPGVMTWRRRWRWSWRLPGRRLQRSAQRRVGAILAHRICRRTGTAPPSP